MVEAEANEESDAAHIASAAVPEGEGPESWGQGEGVPPCSVSGSSFVQEAVRETVEGAADGGEGGVEVSEGSAEEPEGFSPAGEGVLPAPAPTRAERFARFRHLYESRDGGLCVFEDEHGHLVAVDASKLA